MKHREQLAATTRRECNPENPMGLWGSLLSKLSKRQSATAHSLKAAAPEHETVAAVDWRTSGSHLNLLTRFLSPKFRPDRLSDAWTVALGEPPASAIARFVATGLLQPMGPEKALGFALTVAKLKAMLKEAGANVSGNKSELIDRLLVVAPCIFKPRTSSGSPSGLWASC